MGHLWLKVAGTPAFLRSTNLESKLMDVFAFLNGWLKWVGQLWQSELLFNILRKHWSSGEYPFLSSHDEVESSMPDPEALLSA